MIRRANPPHGAHDLDRDPRPLESQRIAIWTDLLSPLKVRMRKGIADKGRTLGRYRTVRATFYRVPEAKRKPLEEKVPLFIPALEMVKTSSGHCKGLLTARNEGGQVGRLFATLQVATQRLNQTIIGVVLPCCATGRRPRFFRSCF